MPGSLRLCLALYKIARQDHRQLTLGHVLLLLVPGLIHLRSYKISKQ